MPGIDHVLFPDGDEIKEACESIRKIASKLNDGNKLRKNFDKLQNINFGKKLGYAFRNPFLVVACLGYSFAQLAFVVTAIVAIQNETLGTIIYYILSIIIGVLANVYVFLVAALWTAVIVGILVAVASVIALIAGICFLFMAGLTCQSNSNRNVNY
jgi:pheromone shutdown protein TraB